MLRVFRFFFRKFRGIDGFLFGGMFGRIFKRILGGN